MSVQLTGNKLFLHQHAKTASRFTAKPFLPLSGMVYIMGEAWRFLKTVRYSAIKKEKMITAMAVRANSVKYNPFFIFIPFFGVKYYNNIKFII